MAEWDFAMWKRNTASSDLPLFYGIGKCSYSSGASTRIALAILGVQSAGFALFYTISTMNISKETEK